jgi:hypothetical protein
VRKPKLAAERREMQALRAMASGTLLQRRSERSLHAFLKMVWPVLEPGRQFTDNWHIHAMCAALEAVAEGRIPHPPADPLSALPDQQEHPGRRGLPSLVLAAQSRHPLPDR